MACEAGSEPVFIDTLALDVGRLAQSEGASNGKAVLRCFPRVGRQNHSSRNPALHLRRR